jgi:hypothetical protein
MRYLLAMAVLSVPAILPAAPQLEPKPYFQRADAEAYRILVGRERRARTELCVTFSVRGKAGVDYTVELYLEVDNTGEKAELLRSMPLKLTGSTEKEQAIAERKFKIRTKSPGEAEVAGQPSLPYAVSARLWSFFLILKEGKQVVAATSSQFIPFHSKNLTTKECNRSRPGIAPKLAFG